MIEYLNTFWESIEERIQMLILSEIKDAVDRDRAGMEMDKQAWTKFFDSKYNIQLQLQKDITLYHSLIVNVNKE